MTFELATRACEILLGFAFIQQSCEHISGKHSAKKLFIWRAVFSLALLHPTTSPWGLIALSLHSLLVLHRFAGPYNGGSDRMGLLVLYCLCLARWLPSDASRELAFGYLSLQLVLSYFISGYVKIVNPEWRRGRALQDVFCFSAYPVSEQLRGLAAYPQMLWAASWVVMLFEVLFVFSLLDATLLHIFLLIGACFHLANACLFGLNRFVWFWLASYPSIIWLQAHII